MIDRDTITETLKFLLPENAELTIDMSSQDYLAYFDWPLKNDPARPNKRSKTVLIKIHATALADLVNIGNKNEAKALIDLETYFKNQLFQFDPEHDAPKGKPEPKEKWEVASLHFLNSVKPIKGVTRRMF